jgi:hypothetical protein
MRIRIALATAVAVILIPVVLLLTVFSGSPSASIPSAGRHEAIGEHRVTTHAVKSSQAKQAQLAAFYQGIIASQQAAWFNAVTASQQAAWFNAVTASQEAAWLNAVTASQEAAWLNAVTASQRAAWLNAVHNSQVAAWLNGVHQSQVAAAPAPRVAAAPATGGGGWSGPWACIAAHESGGNPATNTGNGFYGGLQFTMGTWTANGGTGNPADASIAEQEAVAQQVLASQGWGAWPNSSRACGL